MGALETLWKLGRNTKFLGREREGADEDKGLKIQAGACGTQL